MEVERARLEGRSRREPRTAAHEQYGVAHAKVEGARHLAEGRGRGDHAPPLDRTEPVLRRELVDGLRLEVRGAPRADDRAREVHHRECDRFATHEMAPLHEDAVLAGAETQLLRDGCRRLRVAEEQELDLARIAVPREHFGEGVELAELVFDRAAAHERALALAREHEALTLQLVQRLPDGHT